MTIEPKEHIENFFGENINVTAIVGKNGSGKSSLAESISFQQFSKLDNNKAILFLYFESCKNKFLQYSEKIKTELIYKKILIDKLDNWFTYNYLGNQEKDHLFKIFYSSGKRWFDPREEREQSNKEKLNYEIDLSDFTLFEWYAQQIQYEYNHKLSSFTQIWFFSRTINTLNSLLFFTSKIKMPKDLIIPKNVYLNIDSSFIKNKFIVKDKGFFEKFCFLANNPHNKAIKDRSYILKHLLIQNIISIEELKESFFESLNIDINFDIKVSNKSVEWQKKQIEKVWNHLLKKIDGLKELHLNRFIELLSQEESKFNLISNASEVTEIVSLYRKILNYGKVGFLELRYEPFLSSGAEQLVNLLSRIYIQIEENNKVKNNKFILLVVDEPDIYLHPQWQKQFIQILIDFFKENYKDIKFHIIFTTHSPFLLSDIPKENIIFLDKDDKGNCKVVKGLKEKKQTFGANIHTLLSDSFFMEDGLIGEFAKNKIRTIKVAHQYIIHKNKKNFLFKESYKQSRNFLIKELARFWQIQKLIGEPFLQKIVKNQLEEIELILLGKYEAIDNEIKRLQELQKSLKNG